MKKSSLRYALLLALGLGVNQFAHALGLGPIQVNSYYGQPLSASIRLDGLSAGQAEKTIIRLAGHEAYQTRGIERLPSHEQLKFSLERSGKAYRIKVHSVNSISDPFLNFLITVNSGGSVVTREYSVFLDPDPAQALGGVSKAPKALPAPTEKAPIAQPVKGKAKAQPVPVEPTERRGAMPAGNYNPSALNGDTYGPVGAGDTLYSIANATRPENVSVKAMMNAIKRANRHAFAGNSLKVGATLTIPSEVSGSPKFDAPAEPKRAQKTKKNSEKSASKKAKSTPVKKHKEPVEATRPVVADAVPPAPPTPPTTEAPQPAPPPEPPVEEKIVPEKVIVEDIKLPSKNEPAKTETPPAEVKVEKPVVETPPPVEATLPPPPVAETKPVETTPPEATLPPTVETPPTVEVTLPPPPPPVETVSEPKPIELTSTLPVETPPPPPPPPVETPPVEPVAMEEEGLPAWVPWAAGGAGVGLLGLLSYFLIAKRRAKAYKGEEIEEDLSDEDMEEMLRQFEAEQDDFRSKHRDDLDELEDLNTKKYQDDRELDEVDFNDFNNDEFKRDITLSKPSDDEQDFNQMFGNNNNIDSDDIFIDEDDTPVTLNKKSPPPVEDDFDLGEFSDDSFTEEALSISKSNSKVVTDDDMDFFVDDQPAVQTPKVSASEVAFDEMDFFTEEPAKPAPAPSKPIVEDSMDFFVEDTPAPVVNKPAPAKPADDFGGLDMEFFTEEKTPVVETPAPVKHDNELDFGLDFGSPEPVVEVEVPKPQKPAENTIDFGDFQMDEPKISVSDVVIKPVVEAVKEIKEDVSNALSFDDFTMESASPEPVVTAPKAPSKADEEAMEINLDLADSFIATGNGERAKSWLSEVLELGTEAQKARARQMLDKIG